MLYRGRCSGRGGRKRVARERSEHCGSQEITKWPATLIKGALRASFDLAEAHPGAQHIANLELILKGHCNPALGNRCVLDLNDPVLVTGVRYFVIRKFALGEEICVGT